MSPLLTPDQVGVFLGVRDRRTVARRLAALAVPVVPFGRSYRVRAADLERAVAAAVRVPIGLGTVVPNSAPLAPGARLWDPEPSIKAGPRRVNVRPHGTREHVPVQQQPTNGIPAVPAVLPCAPTTGVAK